MARPVGRADGAVRFGVYIFATDETIGPGELAAAVEERGFESLFVPEHTHIPASRETPSPRGGELAREYHRLLDPFGALGAAAAATERLLIGTGICLVIERDPIVLAKEVATLDHLSGGRFLFGIGAGWNREEMRNHGTDPSTRMALLRERVLAMKRIWTEDQAEFHGEYVSFDPIFQWPKPVQKPHPPILVGGTGPHVIDRVLDYGDEWFPIAREGGRPTVALGAQLQQLRELAAQRGREPIPVSVFGARPDHDTTQRWAELEVDRLVFALPPAGRDEVLVHLDNQAELVASLGV
jgi:probable F420-dependent oxidoreductase